MSKKESKQRLKKRSKARRRAIIVMNILFTIFIISFGIYGALQTFTNKKEYRESGIAEYKSKNYEAAIGFFDKALAEKQWFSENMDADILLYKAECQVMLKQYGEASLTYEKLKEYPSRITEKYDLDLLIRINNSFILFEAGDYENALPGFVAAYNEDYDNLSLYAGICYEHMGDLSNMHKYYDYYRIHNGDDAFLCYKEATYYLEISDDELLSDGIIESSDSEEERYEKALSAIAKGLALDDGEFDKELRFAEIICHERLKDFGEAYDEVKIYLERYPKDEDALKIYKYLETRVEPDNEAVNPIFSDVSVSAGDDSDNSSDEGSAAATQ